MQRLEWHPKYITAPKQQERKITHHSEPITLPFESLSFQDIFDSKYLSKSASRKETLLPTRRVEHYVHLQMYQVNLYLID